jgi:hypothetical protein
VWDIYKRRPGLVLGFHGCDKTTGEAILAGKTTLKKSANDYDWLGPGIYFWEGNPHRALQFAAEAVKNEPRTTQGNIRKPFVVGAVIDAGYCCDLQDTDSLAELARAYDALAAASEASDTPMPENKSGNDRRARILDCAVIRTMHRLRDDEDLRAYDTVRGAFWEGRALYPGAGFSEKQHVQISVVDPASILGYFRPL